MRRSRLRSAMRLKKNRYKIAVGMGYDNCRDEAPRLEVKGEQLLAERIVKTAERFGVPVVANSELARALNAMEVGEPIPEKLYEAVAIVLNRVENKLAVRRR